MFAARASTCAYIIVASKFVTNYRVDKSKEASPRSCSIIAAILEPTIAHIMGGVSATLRIGVQCGDTVE